MRGHGPGAPIDGGHDADVPVAGCLAVAGLSVGGDDGHVSGMHRDERRLR